MEREACSLPDVSTQDVGERVLSLTLEKVPRN